MAQVSFKSNVAAVPDWLALQMRIFTRWINQKLVVRNLAIKDILKDISGDILRNLIEILSEKQFQGKPLSTGAAAKMRVQQIDNAGRALKFAEECGVVMELKCSAENLVDGTEKPVLGLVWAIMRQFMKFGDQDSKMKASDALLGWVKNQVTGYKHAEVKDFQGSFKNGMVLCALLHKFRPKLVGDYDKLQPAQFEVNLKTAFKAAKAYFDLDEYLTPAEIQKLDDKSMVVYVSEYYSGIAAQRKLDVASRRIGKLIATTKHNDALRSEYNERAARLKANLKVAEGVLLDRTVDNNLAGAQKRLDDFYSYQTKEKSLIINDYLSIESLYNQLALKLADHKRPPFVPAAGLELPALRAAFLPLEKCEQERNIALHDEVHRQTELLVINGQHLAKYEKLAAWTAAKLKYLGEKEKVDSSGEAEYQLNRLDAYQREAKATREGTVAEMEALGKKLLDEKFEKAAEVQKREDDIRKAFTELDAAATAKLNILKDDLARNQLMEKIGLEYNQHGVVFNTLKTWLEKEEKSLAKKEDVQSVRDARVFLDHIGLYVRGRADLDDNLVAFAELGKAILAAKHASAFSNWVFPTPEEIKTRDTFIAEKLVRLNDLCTAKKATLEDDLARELFKDALLLKITQHTTEFKNISAYSDEKKAYLSKKEQITSVKDARAALNFMDSVAKGKAAQLEGAVASLKALGADILASKYETKLSSYSTPDPEAVTKREADVDAAFAELATLFAAKQDVLKDDLAREDFREKLELQAEQHVGQHATLKAWVDEKEAFLKVKEEVKSVRDASVALGKLSSYDKSKAEQTETTYAAFKKLGADIHGAKYETKLSSYSYPKAAEVSDRENEINAKWAELDTLYASKLAVGQDDAAREEFREKLLLSDKQHGDAFAQLSAWIAEREAYLKKKEVVESVRDARAALNVIEIYASAKADMTAGQVSAFHKLSKVLVDSKYETKLSSYVLPTPDEVKDRDAQVTGKWAALDTLYGDKFAVLNDDLAREEFREKLLLSNQQHVGQHANLKAWIDAKIAYLGVKENVTNVKDARVQLNLIEVYASTKRSMTHANVPAFKKLGKHVLDAKYETKHSTYSFPTPAEVTDREKWVDDQWAALDEKYAEKLKVLQDDLAREDFREKIELQNEQHEALYGTIKAWIDEKEAYLKKKETCESVRESQVQLNALSVYEKDKAAMTGGAVKAFHKQGAAILEAKYAGLTQYSFPQPEAVKARLDFVDAKWQEFTALHASKLAILQDDLARNEFRDRVALNNDQHMTSHASLKLWVATQELYVDKKEAIDSVQDARVALNGVDVFEKDKAEMRQVDVAAFKKLGKEILDAKYETKLSTYTWPARDEVTGREQWVDSKFDELSQKAAAKKAGLEASLANEIAKEKARVDYASLGADAIRWARDVVETVSVRAFGFTLAAVETFGKTMAAADSETSKQIADRKAKYTAVYEEGVKLGATNLQTKYISQTVAQLDEVLAGVAAALASRVKAWEAELAVQRANDALCREFAGKAVPFVASLQSQKDKLGASTAALEVQVKELEGHIAGAASGIGAPLAEIKSLSEKIAAAKVQSNPHTLLSFKDVDVQWNQYVDFLKRKKKQIEDEIQTKALRGVTPEQMKEIEKQFAQYDADGNKLLELAEFKACLYSLGHDYAALDLKKIMVKFGGTEAALDYAGFKNFMVSLYGDTDTKEEIAAGFKLLNKGKPSADPKLMELMSDADLKYMMENAPKNADGTYDYNKFVDVMFSR